MGEKNEVIYILVSRSYINLTYSSYCTYDTLASRHPFLLLWKAIHDLYIQIFHIVITANPSFHDSRLQLAACHLNQAQGKQVTIHHPINITGQQANFGNQAIYTGANIHIYHHQGPGIDCLETEEPHLLGKKIIL